MKSGLLKRCVAAWLSLMMGGAFVGLLLPVDASAVTQDKEDVQDYDELVRDAEQLMGQQSYKEAAVIWKLAIDQRADNPNHISNYAYSLHMSGQVDAAIEVHKKVAEFPETKALGLYNLGCAYSLKKENEKAIKYSMAAMDAGFDRPEMFETDSDFDNIRKDPKFQDVLARAKNGGKPLKKLVFAGKWKPEMGVRGGAKIPEDRLPPEIKITDKTITIPGGPMTFEMSYTINKNTDPMAIDMKVVKGPQGSDGKALGIVKFEKDQLTLCYDPTGRERPTKFESSKENNRHMFVMKMAAEKFDASKMVGNWQVTKGVRQGNKVGQERLAAIIKFTEKEVTIPVPGMDPFVMSYKLDTSKSPVQIDMAIESGPAPPSKALGIVKYESGQFWLCYHPMGGDRPTKFEATEENGCHLFEMKLAKKAETKPAEEKPEEKKAAPAEDKEDSKPVEDKEETKPAEDKSDG